MQPDARCDCAYPERRSRVADGQLVQRDELEHGALAVGEPPERGVERARLRGSVDTLLDPRDIVAFEQAAPLDLSLRVPFAGAAARLGGDDDARDAKQPCPWRATILAVAPRGRDRRQEHVGRQIGREMRIVESPGDEALHRFDVLAVKRLKDGGIARDPRQLVIHINTWLSGSTALHELCGAPQHRDTSGSSLGGRRVFGMVGSSVAEELAEAVGAPLVLVDRSGWRVEYADEGTARSGTVRFVGPVAAGSPSAVELRWTDGGLPSLMRDRASSGPLADTAPVLGTVAHVYFRHGPGRQKISGLWEGPTGLVLEFVAIVNDLDEFADLLGSLRIVEQNAWLEALPPSTVRPADRASVVLSMLNGVSTPPGFDPNTIKGARLVKDRYQLGAAVAGTVACTWFQRWSVARVTGDADAVREAIDAMATAKTWPILLEMAESGAYPDVLQRFAAAMPSGRWHDRPLEGDVNTGLGCPALGVPLSNPDTA